MNTEQQQRSAKKERQVTFSKLKRDAALLREHAAVVIVLNDEGLVTEVIKRDPRAHRVVRLIVVLAPAVRDGQHLHETSVLEIGFSRSRPYQQVERYLLGTLDFFIKPRIRIRTLTHEEYGTVAPVILSVMRDMLFALRESWFTKEAWEIGPKRVAYERGIYFTVHRSDTHVCAHFLKEDLRFRGIHYFPHNANVLRRIMPSVQRIFSRSEEQLARSLWVARLVEHCAIMRLHALYVRELRKHFPAQEWDAFEYVCRVMGVALPLGDARTRLVDQPFARELPSISGMCLILKHNERVRHAQNCFVAEVFFEKEYREQHEIPF